MYRKSRIPFLTLLLFVTVVVTVCIDGCASNETASVLGIESRLGFDIIKFKSDLGKNISTTPVHPDDSSFLSGETTVYPSDSETDVAPKLGIFSTLGDKRLKFFGGIDCRWNPLHQYNGFREGMYGITQQSSDTRPASQGSFVFTQVIPGSSTLIPSAGIEGRIIGNITLGGSIGFPYMEWKARSGHDRYAKWETFQSDSWDGFGLRYDLTLGINFSNRASLLVSYFDEEYEPNFAGENATIRGCGLLLSFAYSF
jgi:hypothetical protein